MEREYKKIDLAKLSSNKVLVSRDILPIYIPMIGSTNNYAKQYMNEGKKQNALIVADAQSEGRGRKDGRTFYSPNPGIYTSLLLHDIHLDYKSLPLLTILSALAICESIDSHYKVSTEIKWVNDIYLNDKKIVGILCESSFVGSELNRVVIGFGINVYDLEIPQELLAVMSSLEKETGKVVERDSLILDIVSRMLNYINELEHQNLSFIKAYEERNLLIGREVFVEGEGDKLYLVLGISDEGYLIVKNKHELRYLNSQESSVRMKERV